MKQKQSLSLLFNFTVWEPDISWHLLWFLLSTLGAWRVKARGSVGYQTLVWAWQLLARLIPAHHKCNVKQIKSQFVRRNRFEGSSRSCKIGEIKNLPKN